MLIDILCNSCARPEMLEKSVYSTRENIISDKHEFRWVIVEDLVSDLKRRAAGRKWIEDNAHLFDEIVYAKTPAVMDKYWQKVIRVCESDYHVHAEDDTKYLKKIDIDPLIDFLQNNEDVVEIIFSRGSIKSANIINKIIINDLELTEAKMMSNSVGVFNTKNVKSILDEVDWNSVLHENKVLTPAAIKLGFKRFILGHDDQHYIHLGEDKKYRKGKWGK